MQECLIGQADGDILSGVMLTVDDEVSLSMCELSDTAVAVVSILTLMKLLR